MQNPNLYKKETLNNVRNRTTVPPTATEKARASHVILKFFELFKDKHL
jgi:hypothetical protein